MFDISLPAANAIYGLSNAILVLGALFVLLETIGAIWSGGVRERFSDERIHTNELKMQKQTIAQQNPIEKLKKNDLRYFQDRGEVI